MNPSPVTRMLRRAFLFLLGKKLSTMPAELLRLPTVVIAPHQDDEVLGCGGTICLLRKENVPVHIVFLTDGSTSHKKLVPPVEMATIRKKEALSAARVMGVPSDHVHFLGGGEQKLGNRIPEITGYLVNLLPSLAADQYFIPYIFETQPEHTAAAEICRQAIAELENPRSVWEYPVWFWEHYPWIRTPVFGPRSWRAQISHTLQSWCRLFCDFDFRVDITDTLEQKQLALNEHKSQVQGLRDDVDWPVLADVSHGDFSACFVRRAEIFSSLSFP